MSIFGFFAYELLRIYGFLIIVYVVLGILISFNVINNSNKFIFIVMDFLFKVSEPILSKIRKILPNFGYVDVAPLILLIIIETLKYGIVRYSI
tara:strand:- start:440 stop:718 length:279 start_codon:yes stop_codon:yes gene_type:complete